MASHESTYDDLTAELQCLICYEMLRDPVTATCGSHNYCMECIVKYYTVPYTKEKFGCPVCKDTFRPDHKLTKNVAIYRIVETLKRRSPEKRDSSASPRDSDPDGQCPACGSGGSDGCPTCQPRESGSSAPRLGESCALHRRPCEYLCPGHGTLLCALCRPQHPDCALGSIEEEFERKKACLQRSLETVTSEIEQVEEILSERVKSRKEISDSASGMKDALCRGFGELKRAIEAGEREAMNVLNARQKAAEWRIGSAVALLEQRLGWLKNARSQMEQVDTGSCSAVIQADIPQVDTDGCLSREEGDVSPDEVRMAAVLDAVAELKEEAGKRLDQALSVLQVNLGETAEHGGADVSPEGMELETVGGQEQSEALSQKFLFVCQALGAQEFQQGEHYWEVDTGRSSGWAVGVASSRLGPSENLGRTALSWCLEWSKSRLSVWHRNTEEPLKHGQVSKVRVHLDMGQGLLSFYSMAEGETLLFSYKAEFTEPVRPAFWLFGLQQGNTLSFAGP
nr:PREDICTED: E3 ubiquitin/ISG15 ligase TRIM25-like [Lepisosteus oculatus]